MDAQHTSYHPLKIIYIHSNDLSKNETSETFVVNNALSLAERGVEIHLFVTNRSATSGEQILLQKFNIEQLPNNLHLHAYRLSGKGHWSFYRAVAKFIKQEGNEEAVIITRKHSVLPHLVLARRLRQKLIFETHDFFYDLSLRKDLKRHKRRKHSIIEKLFFGKLDALICLNSFQRDLYAQRLSIPIKVFPTGFRMAVQEPAEKEKLLLYIGAFEERKGIDNILNLAQRLDKSYTFVLVGSRKETEINALNAEVQRRGIDDRVQVREWLSKKELNEMLLRAKIGLLPLKAGYFNEFLTVPLKYFDYAAFGLPVIASDFPSLGTYIKDDYNGFLVDWNDLESVRSKVENVMADPQYWRQLSQNQQERSVDLTWEKRAGDQVDYFTQLRLQ